MTRIFRAFLWLRWRAFVNSLERTGARDTIERFSLATEKLGPIIALTLLIPSSLALAAIGLVAGYGTATGSWLIPMEVVRYFLLASTAFTLIGPIVLPLRDAGNVVRFLLLPIPRSALYMAHATGALADPWVLLTLPPLLTIPVGLAAGGALVRAGLALVAGALFLLIIVGLTTVLAATIHLLLRDRRRSDFVMLFLVVILPTLGLIPSMMQARRASDAIAEKAGRPVRDRGPSMIGTAARRAFAGLPSELYARSAKSSRASGAIVPVGGWPMFAPEGYKAFVNKNKKDIEAGKLTLVVADTLKMQLELLRDGYSNALTGQRPFEMGEKAMDTLLAIKTGQKVPEVIYTGLDLVTKDNVAQLLK